MTLNRKAVFYQSTRYLGILLILLFGTNIAAANLSEEIKAQVDAAVDYARKGEFKKSLQLFDRLVEKFPGNPNVFTDHIVVLAWSGNCEKASKVFEKSFQGEKDYPSGYVLKQAAKCYRNLKKFGKSVETYKKVLSASPKDLDALIGLVYAYSDKKEIRIALDLLRKQINENPRKPDLQLALAYVYEKDRDYLKAVLTYDKLLENKKDEKVIHARLRALSKLGAHTAAIASAAEAGIKDPTLLGFLKGNFAARLISWNKNIPQPEDRGERWGDLNRAIKILNEQLEEDRNNERALFDLMGARVLLGHPKGLLRTFERLKFKNKILPNWVKEIVADAYVENAQADPAIAIYEALLQADKDNFYWLKKLYSAYVLKNDLAKASKTLKKLLEKESSPTTLFDGIVTPNWKRVQLETDAAWLTAYKDHLFESQKRFNSLLSMAPHNSSIHSGVAHLLLWRGLPEGAEKEFQWILNYDPTYRSVRTGYAATLMELKKYREAEVEVEKLLSYYPVSRRVEKTKKTWKALTQPGLYAQSTLVQEERGGKDWGADFALHSGLFRYRYRLDVNYSRRQSVADTGNEDYSRAGFGITYEKGRFLSLSQRFGYNPDQGEDFGGITSFTLTPNDHVTVSGNYQTFIFDMPLRARIGGIDGRSFNVSLRLSTDDRMALSIRSSVSHYTDTNRRKSFSLSYRQKIVPGHRYRAFAELNGYIGTNSFRNAVYFNPERGVAYSVTAVNEYTLVNIFRKRFIQNLNVSAGQYRQKGFSAGITADIEYKHRWDLSPGKELVYGVQWKRRIYDGKSEQTPGVYANVRYYF